MERDPTKASLFGTYPCQTVHFDIKNLLGGGGWGGGGSGGGWEGEKDEKQENKLLLSPKPTPVGGTPIMDLQIFVQSKQNKKAIWLDATLLQSISPNGSLSIPCFPLTLIIHWHRQSLCVDVSGEQTSTPLTLPEGRHPLILDLSLWAHARDPEHWQTCGGAWRRKKNGNVPKPTTKKETSHAKLTLPLV